LPENPYNRCGRRAAEAIVRVGKRLRRPLHLTGDASLHGELSETGNSMGVGRDYTNVMLRKQTISDSNVKLRETAGTARQSESSGSQKTATLTAR
jgi:hypothetical protein